MGEGCVVCGTPVRLCPSSPREFGRSDDRNGRWHAGACQKIYSCEAAGAPGIHVIRLPPLPVRAHMSVYPYTLSSDVQCATFNPQPQDVRRPNHTSRRPTFNVQRSTFNPSRLTPDPLSPHPLSPLACHIYRIGVQPRHPTTIRFQTIDAGHDDRVPQDAQSARQDASIVD